MFFSRSKITTRIIYREVVIVIVEDHLPIGYFPDFSLYKYGNKEQFGRAPRQVSADGGFASRNNLEFAKAHEVKDAVFAKKQGLTVIEMAKSAWVYRMLRNSALASRRESRL